MELRHLRYFVAVAEEGSLTVAAEQRLHTAQPSLSRQIRDLEYEVGVPLMTRSVHGIELTAAGRAFLDHARLALTQAEAAASGAARRAARPSRPSPSAFSPGRRWIGCPKPWHSARRACPTSTSGSRATIRPCSPTRSMRGQARPRLHAAEQKPDLDIKAGRQGAAGRDAAERSSGSRRAEAIDPQRSRRRNVHRHVARDRASCVQSSQDYLQRPD